MSSEHRQVGKYDIRVFVTNGTWRQNCYLVSHADSGEQILIDPGERVDDLTAAIANGGPLRQILLTHAHHDHVAGASFYAQKHSIPCLVHEGDQRLLRHAPMYALRFAGVHIAPILEASAFRCPVSWAFATTTIHAVHSPGHTQGSVCYDFGEFCFTGDTLLNKKIGRTDLPGGDDAQLVASVTSLLASFDKGSLTLFPGHGSSWTLDEARSWWKTAGKDADKANDQ